MRERLSLDEAVKAPLHAFGAATFDPSTEEVQVEASLGDLLAPQQALVLQEELLEFVVRLYCTLHKLSVV